MDKQVGFHIGCTVGKAIVLFFPIPLARKQAMVVQMKDMFCILFQFSGQIQWNCFKDM